MTNLERQQKFRAAHPGYGRRRARPTPNGPAFIHTAGPVIAKPEPSPAASAGALTADGVPAGVAVDAVGDALSGCEMMC